MFDELALSKWLNRRENVVLLRFYASFCTTQFISQICFCLSTYSKLKASNLCMHSLQADDILFVIWSSKLLEIRGKAWKVWLTTMTINWGLPACYLWNVHSHNMKVLWSKWWQSIYWNKHKYGTSNPAKIHEKLEKNSTQVLEGHYSHIKWRFLIGRAL